MKLKKAILVKQGWPPAHLITGINSAMINSFKSKRKISAFGQMSNTGRTGLNWEDERNYGSSSNMEVSDDGSMYFTGGNDDFGGGGGGNFYGQGIPRSWNAGINFGNKWECG